jgi:hypothetical protein
LKRRILRSNYNCATRPWTRHDVDDSTRRRRRGERHKQTTCIAFPAQLRATANCRRHGKEDGSARHTWDQEGWDREGGGRRTGKRFGWHRERRVRDRAAAVRRWDVVCASIGCGDIMPKRSGPSEGRRWCGLAVRHEAFARKGQLAGRHLQDAVALPSPPVACGLHLAVQVVQAVGAGVGIPSLCSSVGQHGR